MRATTVYEIGQIGDQISCFNRISSSHNVKLILQNQLWIRKMAELSPSCAALLVFS